MGKKKFDETRPMHKAAKFYQEKFSKLSDIDYKTLTNARAREILGKVFHFDYHHQSIVINDMEELGLIKRNGQQIIELLPV